MLRKALLLVAIGSVLALMVALPSSADLSAPLSGEWNRLSADRSHPAPEHELLRCVQNNGAQAGTSSNRWFCHYSKLPEPTLNFFWNDNQGFFSGIDITGSWTCPAWFPTGVCPNVVQVVEGTMTFFQPSLHPPFPVLEDLVLTQAGGHQVLYVEWVKFGFACPWYGTFMEALAANPLPLPFNGTFPPQDCVFAH